MLKSKNETLKNKTTDLHSVFLRRNRIGAAVAIVLRHVSALLEIAVRILQDVPDTERKSVQPTLLAEFLRVTAKRLAIDLGIMHVRANKHFSPSILRLGIFFLDHGLPEIFVLKEVRSSFTGTEVSLDKVEIISTSPNQASVCTRMAAENGLQLPSPAQPAVALRLRNPNNYSAAAWSPLGMGCFHKRSTRAAITSKQ